MRYSTAQFQFFVDELEKIALSGGQMAGLGTALGAGTLAGAYGKDFLQDAREGKVIRKQRELAQRAALMPQTPEMM
jgi:hypothetical protein